MVTKIYIQHLSYDRMHVWNTCSEKEMPPVQFKLAHIFWYCDVTPFKSRQNELCNVLNTPTVLQLSWQSGFCRRHDVFTSFCEIKCKLSGVLGINDKFILVFRTQIRLVQTLRHNTDKSLGLILIRLGMQRLCCSIRMELFVYQ